MDTSRPPTSADEQQKTRMTNSHANSYAYQESPYHQKPPSFNHKQVNISLVDDGSANKQQQQQKHKEKQQQAGGSGEWRESIPIKLEHLLFNFKENSLKVYKASPPRIMQIIALIAALLLFCGVLALILSQRDDNLKKEANLPSDQSAIAERIIGESKLLNHKLKGSFFDPKNQTALNEKQKKYAKPSIDAKDAAVRKAFGSLIFSNDDNDEPDQEENNSDESFDGERSHSKNFNLFSSDNDEGGNKEKQSNAEQSENPRVMLIERLMGLHFGMQPKFGLSESLVIRKTIDDTDADTANKPENEIDLLLNPRSNHNSKLSKETNKDNRNEEDPTPFLLRYAAAAMLSRVLATAQQQAYIQQLQQQQRFREMNEKQMFNSPYKGYRGYRNFNVHESAESSPSYLQREPTMYGRPMHPRPHSSRPPMFGQPPMQAPQFGVSSDRSNSRFLNEEAESQQIHPIILMLNLPYKDQQTPATSGAQLMLMSPAQSSFAHQAIEPIFMPYASRQNPYYKQPQPQPPAQREQIYSPFAHKPFYQPQTAQQPPQQQNLNSHESGYYSHYTSHPHSYNSMIHQHQPINSNYRPQQQQQPSRTYIQRVPNTIEVPIEIHHQVTPSISPAIAQNAQAQIIVQPQIETAQSQPNDQSNDQDQSGENEHHMVVFYSDADNLNHSEESNNQAVDNQQPQPQPQPQPQQPVFVKESKQINQDLEKANQISKMLLLHFVNPNQQPQSNQQVDTPNEQQNVKPFLVQPSEKPQANSKLEEMTLKPVTKMQDKVKEIKSEDEPQSNDNQMKREELEKQQDGQSETSEVEPTSLAHFAQAIRHVIDQQQQSQQNQEQQRPAIQPILIEPAQPIAPQQPVTIQSQQASANAGGQPTANYQPVQLARKEQIVENSNKESQESRIPAPAFMLAPDNEEN